MCVCVCVCACLCVRCAWGGGSLLSTGRASCSTTGRGAPRPATRSAFLACHRRTQRCANAGPAASCQPPAASLLTAPTHHAGVHGGASAGAQDHATDLLRERAFSQSSRSGKCWPHHQHHHTITPPTPTPTPPPPLASTGREAEKIPYLHHVTKVGIYTVNNTT